MVIYEVTAVVQAGVVEEYEKFMVEQHIPDLLATEYFHAAYFTRSSGNHYRIQYQAHDQTTVDEYIKTKAEGLRQDFLAHFPEGVELSREIWKVLQVWERD